MKNVMARSGLLLKQILVFSVANLRQAFVRQPHYPQMRMPIFVSFVSSIAIQNHLFPVARHYNIWRRQALNLKVSAGIMPVEFDLPVDLPVSDPEYPQWAELVYLESDGEHHLDAQSHHHFSV